jgi:hypothetical protein
MECDDDTPDLNGNDWDGEGMDIDDDYELNDDDRTYGDNIIEGKYKKIMHEPQTYLIILTSHFECNRSY